MAPGLSMEFALSQPHVVFADTFRRLTGNPPFPWQTALFERFARGEIPGSCNLPTGLGKTSVIAVWLAALAGGAALPRRLVYVVNRRTVVDQTTEEVEKYRRNLDTDPGLAAIKTWLGRPLALSTLRGQFADNREWSDDPSRPAAVCGTVDMVGSRLLFGGYGVGWKSRPLHAGFLGQDALLVHDEAHLEPAFQQLIEAIQAEQAREPDVPWPKFRVMALTATPRGTGDVFTLTDHERLPEDAPADSNVPVHIAWRRLAARKAVEFHPVADEKQDLVPAVARLAMGHRDDPAGPAVLVFVRTVQSVGEVVKELKAARVPETNIETLTGTMRGLDRDQMLNTSRVFAAFKNGSGRPAGAVFLVCTAAGEVGVDMSADHLVCDLSTYDGMAQRFGRVNRYGLGDARIDVVVPRTFRTGGDPRETAREKTLGLLNLLRRRDDDRRDASPAALGELLDRAVREGSGGTAGATDQVRELREYILAAFAPPPVVLPATDILFDAWALTTVRGILPGRPFVLEPWQQAIIANLFGWMRTDDQGRVVRRYREALIYVSRKNGKPPLVAGIGLYVFFCDREAGLQGYIAAKDRDQAGLLFRQIEGMVAANPYMAKRCRAYGGNAPGGKAKSLAKPDNSFLKVISADAGGKHGGNSHLVIVDELHEQADRHLIDTLRTSMTSANRKQPLMVYLTTADYDRPSICNERYEFAKKVCADPARDPAFFPVVYEADPGDPWDSEATWAKANPNLGVSVSRAELKRLAAEAADNPALKAEFRRLHTNVRVQKTIASAIDLTLWDGAGAAPLPADLAGRACWAGLDLGWRDDLAALALLFDLGDGRVGAGWRFWVPADGKRDLTAVPFAGFVGGGWLDVTAGNTTDFRAIRDVLDEAAGRYDLRALFIDPSYARSESTELVEAGFPVTEFRQNPASYTAAWKWLIADGLKGGKLAHGNNPVARWQAGHVAVDVNGADGVMPRKRKSTEKIDGICAVLMAVAAWLADPDRAGGGSVYESRGLESIYGEEPTAAVHPAPAGADQGPTAEVAAPEEPPRWIFGDPDD